MDHERQVELLERVAAAGPQLVGLHGDASTVNDASVYTDPSRFEREMAQLFRGWPMPFALSCELRDPGSSRADTIAGVPIVVVRQDDGTVRALVNICRHRGAPVTDDGEAGCGRAFSGPYHAWTYELDGTLRSRPGSAGAFDDLTEEMGLLPLPVAEAHGLIFVRPGGGAPIDVDAHLAGAQHDLGSFGLQDYVHIETRTNTWPFNWKLVLDTFTESYHVRTLHKGTMQYFIVPGALVVHQIDHIEVWRLQPNDVRTTTTLTSIYAPTEPHSERSRNYFVRNLEFLLEVTGREDFSLMAKIQKNLDAGAVRQVVYGRNEPALAHLHRSIDSGLDDAPAPVLAGVTS